MSAWHHFRFYHVLPLKVKQQGLKRSGSLWRLSKVVKTGSSSFTPRSHDYYLHTFPAWMNFLPRWIMWSMSVDELHLVQVPEYFFFKEKQLDLKNKTTAFMSLIFTSERLEVSDRTRVAVESHSFLLLWCQKWKSDLDPSESHVAWDKRNEMDFSKLTRQNRERLRNSHIIFLRCSGYLLIRRSTPHSSFHIMVSAWCKQID